MKVKKILSVVISAAMCFSLLSANVAADEAATENSLNIVDNYNDTSFSSVSNLGTAFRYEDISQLTNQISVIPKNDNEDGITTYAGNTAPVSGLTNRVANPETMLNGKLTTDTIVYWLWYDGETHYSYDPDGDEITNYLIGGVNSYILGNVTLNDEVVGFATQITRWLGYRWVDGIPGDSDCGWYDIG